MRIALPVGIFLFYVLGHLMNRETDSIPPRRPQPTPPEDPREAWARERARIAREQSERPAPLRWGPRNDAQPVHVERRRIGGEEILVLSTAEGPPSGRQEPQAPRPQPKRKPRAKQATAKQESKPASVDTQNPLGGQLVIEPLVTGALATAASSIAIVTNVDSKTPPLAISIRDTLTDRKAIQRAILINEILLPPLCARRGPGRLSIPNEGQTRG